MWRRGHPILPPYPARFGHETAGCGEDTGERVLVGDSVACGACRPCAAGRPQICRAPRWVLGGFAELIAAPVAALHAIPDGLRPAGAAMAEPLAAAVHAVARAPAPRARAGRRRARRRADGPDARRAARGRGPDGHGRRPPSRAPGAGGGGRRDERGEFAEHDVVFEAVGRPEAWRAAVRACAPGGCVVLVGRLRGGHRRRGFRPARCTTTRWTSAARSTIPPPRSTARCTSWPPGGRLARARRWPDRPGRAPGPRSPPATTGRRANGSSRREEAERRGQRGTARRAASRRKRSGARRPADRGAPRHRVQGSLPPALRELP